MKENYVMIPRSIQPNKELSPKEKIVYAYCRYRCIASTSDETYLVSISRLSKTLGMSRGVVGRLIGNKHESVLLRSGLLESEKCGGAWYVLNPLNEEDSITSFENCLRVPLEDAVSKKLSHTDSYILAKIREMEATTNKPVVAGNQYLSDTLGVSMDTVSKSITKLSRKQYIKVNIKRYSAGLNLGNRTKRAITVI